MEFYDFGIYQIIKGNSKFLNDKIAFGIRDEKPKRNLSNQVERIYMLQGLKSQF
jgi:hypothetical protein